MVNASSCFASFVTGLGSIPAAMEHRIVTLPEEQLDDRKATALLDFDSDQRCLEDWLDRHRNSSRNNAESTGGTVGPRRPAETAEVILDTPGVTYGCTSTLLLDLHQRISNAVGAMSSWPRRMQPMEDCLPMESGSMVPWMP